MEWQCITSYIMSDWLMPNPPDIADPLAKINHIKINDYEKFNGIISFIF